MAELKSVMKDTAIYGLSSIVGRFLNYLLVPLYTGVFAASSGGYGIITNIYGYVALVLVLLTFGMETTFFRFANKKGENPTVVYTTTLMAVAFVAFVFVAFVLTFLPQVSTAIGYSKHPEYVGMMAVCIAIDAFQSIPFAWLRFQKRPIKFATLKLLFVAFNIILNLLYFVTLPALYSKYPEWIGQFYNPHIGVGYVFGLNLICSASITVFFWPELIGFKYIFDVRLIKRMLSYSWPILILGVAGILNQTADKILFPLIYGNAADGNIQLGIYGASVKIAMIMAMITQAFRYAYEPFVFGKATDKNSPALYARAMKFFIIFTLLAFLCVMGYLDLLKYLIPSEYWTGLSVVPIVMLAEIMMGIYFNLSFWYKLIDKTIWGAWFSAAGCVVLIIINIVFIPQYGFMACAWGGFAGYATAMLLSYFVGQKKNPIAYPLKSIFTYLALTAILYSVMTLLPQQWPLVVRLSINTGLILLFTTYLIRVDFPLEKIPFIGNYFKKKKRV